MAGKPPADMTLTSVVMMAAAAAAAAARAHDGTRGVDCLELKMVYKMDRSKKRFLRGIRVVFSTSS